MSTHEPRLVTWRRIAPWRRRWELSLWHERLPGEVFPIGLFWTRSGAERAMRVLAPRHAGSERHLAINERRKLAGIGF